MPDLGERLRQSLETVPVPARDEKEVRRRGHRLRLRRWAVGTATASAIVLVGIVGLAVAAHQRSPALGDTPAGTSPPKATNPDPGFTMPTPPGTIGPAVEFLSGQGWSLSAQDLETGIGLVMHTTNGVTDTDRYGETRATCSFAAVAAGPDRDRFVVWGGTATEVRRLVFQLDGGGSAETTTTPLPEGFDPTVRGFALELPGGKRFIGVTVFDADGQEIHAETCSLESSAQGTQRVPSPESSREALYPPPPPPNSPPPSILGSEVPLASGEGWSLGAQDSDVGLVLVFRARNGATDIPYVGLAKPTCAFGAMDIDTSKARQYLWWGVTSPEVARVRFELDDGSSVEVVPNALPDGAPEHDSYKWLTLALAPGVQTTEAVGYFADGAEIPVEDCQLGT